MTRSALPPELAMPVEFAEVGDGDELAALLSLYLRVPAAWVSMNGTALKALERRTSADGSTCVGLAASASKAGARHASELWTDETLRELHLVAAAYWTAVEDPCSAVFHLEQAGEIEAAIDLLKRSWHHADFAIGHDRFLRCIQRLSRAQRGADALELLAIQRHLASMPWASDFDAELGLRLINLMPDSLDSLPARTRTVVTAAAILSLITAGRVRQAVTMGESFIAADNRSAENEEGAWVSTAYLWSALAEAHAMAGSAGRANYFATRAEDVALAEHDSFLRFRSVSLQAAAHALNGEYPEAARLRSVARTVAAEQHWALTPAHLPLLLSELLSACGTLDQAALSAVSAVLGESFPSDPSWTSASLLGRAMLHLCRREAVEGVTLLRRALNGAGEWGFTGLVRAFALGIHADLLLSTSSPSDAIALLSDAQSPVGHAVCFDIYRSSAHLLIGRPREVLRATDGCIAMGASHSLRTLPPVLLRRAIAFDRLGLVEAADQAFREAFQLIRDAGSLIPLINLPSGLLEPLWERLAAAHPEDRADIAGILANAPLIPSSMQLTTDLSRFTDRELTIAAMLRSGAEPIEIAEQLFLSTNTVKVHLRNIYRKLNVHTRSEALIKIESAGVHSLPSTAFAPQRIAPQRQRVAVAH